MNTSSSAQPTTDTNVWDPAAIASVINICMTALVAALALHSSYRHRHLHSKCFGTPCCEMESDQTPADGPRPAVVLSP